MYTRFRYTRVPLVRHPTFRKARWLGTRVGSMNFITIPSPRQTIALGAFRNYLVRRHNKTEERLSANQESAKEYTKEFKQMIITNKQTVS